MVAKQRELSEKWDKHWEALQQRESAGRRASFSAGSCVVVTAAVLVPSVLEVHQFAQEAVVAEAWLTAQEPFISSKELGASVDEVEQLIRRHEAFRKAAATWEERFSSLRRLTTVSPRTNATTARFARQTPQSRDALFCRWKS